MFRIYWLECNIAQNYFEQLVNCVLGDTKARVYMANVGNDIVIMIKKKKAAELSGWQMA